jgi:hypothetical protein
MTELFSQKEMSIADWLAEALEIRTDVVVVSTNCEFDH